ncbi:PP2C family serine/threonine-protein phosphatase [Marinobacter sp. SS8-8]|mgnify:CR=1 FL=1|uniref:protein phosphatase 2C domain-containing protein n=1 Tax=Marinobacter sp. SS8-8 TaxID=3050452 RepID=UPI0026E0CAC5|nr:PP2C family serine/threonine-protein phosphatase [Marinobacter sp. SS8-8]|tara:strand:- start:21623 stop:22378 length:756 start_codon:yes stop_codon:yes gene_type:complete
MRYRIAGQSHRGAVRKSNQDVVDWRVNDSGDQALLVVADGMGGYQGGEIASRLAVDAVVESLEPEISGPSSGKTVSSVRESLERAFALANERILSRRAEDAKLEKMGTTLVVAWVTGDRAHIAHIGDSRCYALQGRQAVCLTRDDTVVQSMLEDGSITEADVPNVPFRNVLTRAVGAVEQVQPSYRVESLEKGDVLLLCSDGLTHFVPEARWLEILRESDGMERRAQAMIDAGLANEAGDNVSVVLLTLEY